MIVVKNTKELEQKYNISMIPDDEMIQVLGGLAGKTKYNEEKYQRRVTYPARQLKQIILEMQEIEREIPSNWSDWQRAKYIYEVLADNIEYNHNEKEYSSQQCSNLSILLSKKGICAGYSLLYKEMMDRQGIPCDYIRGEAILKNGVTGNHAWNVLSLGGKLIGVDLTWDSGARCNGEKGLNSFGDDPDFLHNHKADSDEPKHSLTTFSKKNISAISTDIPDNINQSFSKEDQMAVINYSIAATYKKYKQIIGEEKAIKLAESAVYKYITRADPTSFTRDSKARNVIIENMKPSECLDLIIESYIKQIQMSKKKLKGALQYLVRENIAKYGVEYTKDALRKYIVSGKSKAFTRSNNAKNVHMNGLDSKNALKSVINAIVLREVEKERDSERRITKNTKVMQKKYRNGDEYVLTPLINEKKNVFNSIELVQVEPPKEKEIILKAINWMKDKVKLRQNQVNIDSSQKRNIERTDYDHDQK